MPEKHTIDAAKADVRAGKSRSSAAGEFVREEMHHIREGKHGARSTKQAIAIGLSKARRAGYDPGTPKTARAKAQAKRDNARAHEAPSKSRSRATLKALKHEGHAAASHAALSKHAHQAAMKHTAKERSASARKAARTRAK